MNKRFRCAECPSKFSAASHLQTHVRTVHEKLKPFQCAKCPKSFGRKGILAVHVRTIHEKLKPFQCAHCSKSYSQKGNLAHHVSVVHERLRPYACATCDETFSTRRHLQTHAAMHTRAEGHECPVCHVKLQKRHGLNLHITKQHTAKRASGLKRKPHDESATHDALRAKRIKAEQIFVEDIEDEVDNELVEESKLAGESEAAGPPPAGVLIDAVAGASNDDDNEQQQTSPPVLVKAEEEEATGEPSLLVRRLRCTVNFKTSSGSILTLKNQPASMTFGDFRKLFCIPPGSRKLIVFKKAHGDANVSDEWIVPDGESTHLPFLDGRIMAETWTDF